MPFEETRGRVAQMFDLIALALALIAVVTPYAIGGGSLAPWERVGRG